MPPDLQDTVQQEYELIKAGGNDFLSQLGENFTDLCQLEIKL